MGSQKLAEGIILQTIEDLWNEEIRNECIEFFRGEGFATCAKMAGVTLFDQIRILDLVNDIIKKCFRSDEEFSPNVVKSWVDLSEAGTLKISKDMSHRSETEFFAELSAAWNSMHQGVV